MQQPRSVEKRLQLIVPRSGDLAWNRPSYFFLSCPLSYSQPAVHSLHYDRGLGPRAIATDHDCNPKSNPLKTFCCFFLNVFLFSLRQNNRRLFM